MRSTTMNLSSRVRLWLQDSGVLSRGICGRTSKGFCLSEWTETATLRVEVYNSHTENVLRVHGKIILEGRWVK